MMTPEQLKTLKGIVEDKQATIERLDVTNEVDYKAAERLEREIKDITAAIETIEKLPVTADGVRVEHGMNLWIWTTEGTLLLDFEADLSCFIGRGDSGRALTCHAERCYSTREAAEAAAKEGGGDA